MSSNDARGSLTRRFTMNALPTLSPIGQQRRQAAGETQLVSTYDPQPCTKGRRRRGGEKKCHGELLQLAVIHIETWQHNEFVLQLSDFRQRC